MTAPDEALDLDEPDNDFDPRDFDWGDDPGYPYGDACVHCDGVGCRFCGYGGI